MTRPNLRDPDNWIPRELFAAYCGPGSDKLLTYYDKARAKRNMISVDFDLLAFLALPAWLGYRQQWALWAVLTGLLAVLPFIEVAAGVELPNAAFTGTLLALGLMARGLLLSNATGLFLKLKAQGLAPEAIQSALAGRASPRLPFAFAGLFGALVIIMGAVLLAELLGGDLPR
jgi:hypothetical protein